MILIIKTKDGKTEVTDDRGNVFATLHGVKDVRVDGVIHGTGEGKALDPVDINTEKVDIPPANKKEKTSKKK